jgi:hypothetical protein
MSRGLGVLAENSVSWARLLRYKRRRVLHLLKRQPLVSYISISLYLWHTSGVSFQSSWERMLPSDTLCIPSSAVRSAIRA